MERVVFLVCVAMVTSGCDSLLGVFDTVVVFASDTTFVSEPIDLDADPSRPAQPVPPAVDLAGLLVSARAEADTLGGLPLRSYDFVVSALNPSADTIALDVMGCTVRPEVYGNPERAGDPIWQEETGGYQCTQAPYTKHIAPGDTAEFYSHVRTETLRDGRYYFRARFLLPGDTLWFDTGSTDVLLNPIGIEYQAHVSDGSQTTVDVVLGVRNAGTGTVSVTYGASPVSLTLFHDADRRDLAARWYRRGPFPSVLYLRELAPGDALDAFHTRLRTGDLDVPAGVYHLSVVFQHNSRPFDIPIGIIIVP